MEFQLKSKYWELINVFLQFFWCQFLYLFPICNLREVYIVTLYDINFIFVVEYKLQKYLSLCCGLLSFHFLLTLVGIPRRNIEFVFLSQCHSRPFSLVTKTTSTAYADVEWFTSLICYQFGLFLGKLGNVG